MDLIYKYESVIRLTVFAGSFGLLALVEAWRPRRVLQHSKLKRWLNNFSMVALGTVAVRFIAPTAAVGVAYIVEQNQWGVINHAGLPFWAEVVVAFVLLDLSIYLQHAMFHVLPSMWRFHRIHHSDLDCDVTTGLRFHPLEIVLSVIIKFAVIFALGAPVLAVIVFEIVLNAMSMFTHSNIRLAPGFEKKLRWFLVTPDMHRIHHSVRENETNSNFAFHLSIWDRIAGTYMANPQDSQEEMKVGLDQFREPKWQTVDGLLTLPFIGGIRGYAINYRDTRNADELAIAKQIAIQNQEKAKLASELASYMQAIDQHALVSSMDPSGTIIHVNRKFCNVSGYSESELIGQKHRVSYEAPLTAEHSPDILSIISSTTSWSGETRNRSKSGQEYWLDSTIVPVRDSSGKIERYIEVGLDVTGRKRREAEIKNAYKELTRANIELKKLSRIDKLTNVANRRHFDETLNAQILRHARQPNSLTLCLCDIDYFKDYNDLYGHPAGDACLQKVAQVIQSCFQRSGDLVARYGGEEFAIILPNTDEKAALQLMEETRCAVKALNLRHASSKVAEVVTISIGIASMAPDVDISIDQFIADADEALYAAKKCGRDNTQCCAKDSKIIKINSRS